ncbi:hypothetical protein E2C01_076486 [Portunus trituberculatus]|uniref:Uncharacterized protein n=1 Tax=Portunus trituberculatus TaxID=210409 RepID=A0A5B7IIY2_PORTR|nr:hypothetical protein [Portunus trituberculatus]
MAVGVDCFVFTNHQSFEQQRREAKRSFIIQLDPPTHGTITLVYHAPTHPLINVLLFACITRLGE